MLGHTTQVACNIKANPLTIDNVTWTKVAGPPKILSEAKLETHSNSSITYIVNTLEITSGAKDDYGKYTCTGVNYLGQISASIWVYIQCKSLFFRSPFTDMALLRNFPLIQIS